jgi:hypothetical protein
MTGTGGRKRFGARSEPKASVGRIGLRLWERARRLRGEADRQPDA